MPPTKTKQKSSKKPINLPLMSRLWKVETLSLTQIAQQLQISRQRLSNEAKKHKLPPRKNANSGRVRQKDPTPEELAARAAELRAGWSEKEKAARYCGPKPMAWRVPSFVYNQSTGEFRS